MTPTRERILNYLNLCGHSPTVREIAKAVGLKSSATVQFHLGRLEREGLIERHGPERRISVKA